jgi:protein gp37
MPTKIQWTNETWNPIVGCSKVSDGCRNCYAERMAYRLQRMGIYPYHDHPDLEPVNKRGWTGLVSLNESAMDKPLHWKKSRMIFVCSMGDLFHESVPFEWIDKVIAVITLCPQHTFQILTKRADRMLEYFKLRQPSVRGHNILIEQAALSKILLEGHLVIIPPSNLWLGVTCENQKCADQRIPTLLQIPAAVRFLSLEPLLEDININIHYLRDIKRQGFSGYYDSGWKEPFQWVIIGCESGPSRRPCKLEWVRNIVSQCRAANVPIFVKQLPFPLQSTKTIHRPNSNCLDDDIEIYGSYVEHDIEKFPEDLRIREYPK